MQQPKLPPESTSKYTPTFQFPKSLLQPMLRPIVRLQDAGILPGARLRQHVVICGFPRSGTTLLQLMIEACVLNVKAFRRERRGLEIAQFRFRTHSEIMTKRPKDVFLVQSLREFYATHSADVRFILLNRDPRAVLTSLHFSRPADYFVSVNHWRSIYEHWKWAVQSTDVLSVRYEDLICNPEDVESRIRQLTGWTVTQPFRTFYQSVPKGFDGRSLNGLRELDIRNVDLWRQHRHKARIQSLLREMPELTDVLIELGYESDDRWTRDYSEDQTPSSPAA